MMTTRTLLSFNVDLGDTLQQKVWEGWREGGREGGREGDGQREREGGREGEGGRSDEKSVKNKNRVGFEVSDWSHSRVPTVELIDPMQFVTHLWKLAASFCR